MNETPKRTGVEEATGRLDMVKRKEFDALVGRVAALEEHKTFAVAEPPKASDGAVDEERKKILRGRTVVIDKNRG